MTDQNTKIVRNVGVTLTIDKSMLPTFCKAAQLFSIVSLRIQGVMQSHGELSHDQAVTELQRLRDFLSTVGKINPNAKPSLTEILDLLSKKELGSMLQKTNAVLLCSISSTLLQTILLGCFKQMSEQKEPANDIKIDPRNLH